MLDFNEDKQSKRIDELRLKEAEELAQALAQKYQIPYIDLTRIGINTDALRLVPEAEARTANVAAFHLTGRTLDLAMMSPHNQQVQAIIDDLKEKNFVVNPHLVSETSLARAWDRYKEIGLSTRTKAGVIDISDDDINDFIKKLSGVKAVRAAIDTESQAAGDGSGGISTLLEIILAGSLSTEASDIHLEPQEDGIRLRYRLDGVLQDITNFHPGVYKQLLSRVKLISGLKLNVKQSAQDGRFSIKADNLAIEIRTSVLPGAYGESIVMRVLNPKTIAIDFETLGIDSELLKIFYREIAKPNGLILLTGPTGSGKTTTLYAFLRKVNSTETKIITIEDPIEYHLTGVNQTQVNTKQGYTFLSGLRSALRQDPDIIMVGEIRDAETAKIAINSAQTGHLVFSTLHTNNSAGTIPRLIDLGINPKVISSSLTVSIAQRLVRKLCTVCRKAEAPTGANLELITKVVESIKLRKPNLTLPKIENIYQAVGCDKCNDTGYKGREGVYEAILMDEAVAAAAIANPSEREIKIAARPQGILDMRQDGILKVLAGSTTLDELGRVVDLGEEII